MGAGHGHGHAGARHRWRLAVAFGLVASFFGVELAVGLATGSLALISDAGHMAADVVALGAALVATKIATRPDATGRRTYGSYRAEVFASGLAVLLMLGVAVYVVVEAVARIGARNEGRIRADACGRRRRPAGQPRRAGSAARGSAESLAVKGAYLEVVADTAGSVGVIVAGVLVFPPRDDRTVHLGHAGRGGDRRLRLLVRALLLGRQVLAVLGQHVPHGMDVQAVTRDLAAVDGVRDVHDLHSWTLTSGMNVATAHLVLRVGADAQVVLAAAGAALREGHGIEHATLQVEALPAQECHAATW